MTSLLARPAATLLLCVLALSACERDVEELGLEAPRFPTTPEVFVDGFSGGLNYAAFGGSFPAAFQVDDEVVYAGDASMRFEVPEAEAPEGGYAGGAFFTDVGRDLSGYNVLTFWAKASIPASLDVVGFGNDFAESPYVVTLNDLALSTNWRKYYLPIPDPARLTQERGMFYYAEGPQDGRAYTFWIDELRFENLGTVATPRGLLFGGEDRSRAADPGTTIELNPSVVTNLPTGVDLTLAASSAYFDYATSDASVATVDERGVVTVLGGGTATITASLGGEPAGGSLTISSSGVAVQPLVAAPTPTLAADDVVAAVYSNAYATIPVDFYNGFWEFSTTQNTEEQIAGDDVIRYTELNFVGIQFTNPTIDVTAANRFRMDVWTPEPVDADSEFKVLLFDVGADLTFGTTDDASHEVTVRAPLLESSSWVTLDFPLSDFAGLTSRMHLAQIVLSGSLNTVYVDNLLFYEGMGGGGGGGGGGNDDGPQVAAPTPTRAAADVISLFSDAYDDVPVETWRTDWSMAGFADVEVAGNPTKKYTDLSFVGVETIDNQLDLTDMTHVHVDVWSDDYTLFGIKLVDAGADGAITGDGDDSEHEVTFANPARGEWVSLDIPLADFTGLSAKQNLAQYLFVAQPSGAATVWVDNVYFWR